MKRSIQTNATNNQLKRILKKNMRDISEFEQEPKSGYVYGSYENGIISMFLNHDQLTNPTEYTFKATIDQQEEGVVINWESVKDKIKLRNRNRIIYIAIMAVGCISLPVTMAKNLWMVSIALGILGIGLFVRTFSKELRVHQVLEERLLKIINELV